jgi:hypothetical protein
VRQEHDWIVDRRKIKIERRINSPAFTGYITAQICQILAIPLLKAMRR